MLKHEKNHWPLGIGLAVLAVVVVIGARIWLAGFLEELPPEGSGQPTPTTTSQAVAFSGLAEHKQKIIWDNEHTTFELETHFGKPFTAALKSRSSEALQAYFVDSFSSQLPTEEGEIVEQGAFREQRLVGPGLALQSADTEHTIDYLINLLDDFETIDSVKLRVLQIAHLSDKQWQVEFLLSAYGSQADLPIEFELLSQAECQFLNDEEIGIGKILQSLTVTSQATRRSRQVLMEEVTERVGLAELAIHDNWLAEKGQTYPQHFQIAVEDFNRDGFPDIAIANAMKPPLLLRSVKGQSFEDVAAEMGIKSWRATKQHFTFLVGWIDYDNDGYSDLLMGDSLYRNVEGEKFVEVESGLRFRTQPSGCVVADYDCDGLLDLYVMYQAPTDQTKANSLPWIGDHDSGAPNELWRNEGHGRFRDVTKETKADGGLRQSFSATWLLSGEDRFPDLYIANDFGENVFLQNDGSGVFQDQTHKTQVGDFATSMGVSAGDLNNDGQAEIYVGNMFSKMGRRIIAHVEERDYPAGVHQGILGSCAGNRLYSPGADGSSFTEISEPQGVNQVGWTHGTAMGDFDGDGWLDLYSTAGYMSFHRDRPDG